MAGRLYLHYSKKVVKATIDAHKEGREALLEEGCGEEQGKGQAAKPPRCRLWPGAKRTRNTS